MEYRTNERGGVLDVSMSGRLTYQDHAGFRNILTTIRASSAKTVRLGLAEVEFVDSAGLGMLLMARDAAGESGHEIRLAGPQGQVERLLRSNRFDSLFAVE